MRASNHGAHLIKGSFRCLDINEVKRCYEFEREYLSEKKTESHTTMPCWLRSLLKSRNHDPQFA